MQNLAFCLLTAAALLLGALGAVADPRPGDRVPDRKAVVQGHNEFALDLYGRLSAEPGNLFVSPYSISTALAMTYAGARGPTAEEMGRTLHFALDPQRLHPAFADLIRDLNGSGKQRPFQLSTANALWGQKGHGFLKPFLDLTQANYGAGLREVDFLGATEQARLTINRWVEDQTNHKIRDLLKPGDLDPHGRLVLTNAIYFKAAWAHPFFDKATRQEDFLANATDKVTVAMMHEQEDFKYFDGGTFQIVELPYEGREQSMLVLLPKKPDGLPDLEKELTAANLERWLAGMKSQPVRLALPKFKFTKREELKKTLAAMGMRLAFSSQADFSGMDGRKDLYIDEVIHQAFVDVNEKGTEAAAATAVVMRLAAVPNTVREFRADHPFVFAIRDNRTGSILFLGRVTNPT